MRVFEFGDVDACVEGEAGYQILRLQASSGSGGKFFAEVGKILPRDTQPRSHVVSAEGTQQFGAVAEGFDEGKGGDTASAAVSAAFVIEADDNGGSMVFAA